MVLISKITDRFWVHTAHRRLRKQTNYANRGWENVENAKIAVKWCKIFRVIIIMMITIIRTDNEKCEIIGGLRD